MQRGWGWGKILSHKTANLVLYFICLTRSLAISVSSPSISLSSLPPPPLPVMFVDYKTWNSTLLFPSNQVAGCVSRQQGGLHDTPPTGMGWQVLGDPRLLQPGPPVDHLTPQPEQQSQPGPAGLHPAHGQSLHPPHAHLALHCRD